MTTATAPAELAGVVQEQLAKWSVPGMSVGVLHDSQIETWGFGVTNIETGYPVQPDTVFQIGSISKIFTAVAVMQLVDEGVVELDAPVYKALPSFRLGDAAAQEAVTPRQLLTHTCGFFGDTFQDFGPGDDSLTRALAEFPTLRQITPPGEQWSYCNTAFQALGAIIEHHRQRTAERAITRRVIRPLGLQRSTFFLHEAITYSAAVGHNFFPGKDLAVARPYPLIRCMNAAGGIIGSAADLLRFAQFHLGDGTTPSGDRVLSAEAVRAMQQPQVEGGLADHWGLGWSLRSYGGTTLVGHGGSTNGFRAQLAIVPEQGVAVALLTNGSNGSAAYHEVEAWLLERYAGLHRQVPAAYPLSSAALARVAGHYAQERSDIRIAVAGEGLAVDVVTRNIAGEELRPPTVHARPIGPRRFLLTDTALAGGWLDFIGEGEHPRFARWGGRLADRVRDDA